MRTTQICVRAGLAVVAAALPSALGTTAAVAAGDFTMTATGSTAQATRQVEPAEGSGSWRTVAVGTRTVRVAGEDGTTPTSMPTMSSTTAPTSMPTTSPVPTTSPTTAPARGVRGGLGGGSEDRGTLAMAAGGTLVAAAVGTGLWYLRRRGARGRP